MRKSDNFSLSKLFRFRFYQRTNVSGFSKSLLSFMISNGYFHGKCRNFTDELIFGWNTSNFLKKTFVFQGTNFCHAFMRVSLFTIRHSLCNKLQIFSTNHIKKNTKPNFRGDIFSPFFEICQDQALSVKKLTWSLCPATRPPESSIYHFSSINHICYLKVIFSIF